MEANRKLAMKTKRHRRSLVEPGTYEHYKGGLYTVLYVAMHTETGEELVVYQSLCDGRMWVRPRSMFCDEVILGGSRFPRFMKLMHPSLISFAGAARQAA